MITIPKSALAEKSDSGEDVTPGVGDSVECPCTLKVVGEDGDNCQCEVTHANGQACDGDGADSEDGGDMDMEDMPDAPKDKAGKALLILAMKDDKKNNR